MIIHKLRNTWKDLIRKHDKVDVKSLGTPFYQQTKAPFLVRFAWPFVFANVVIAVVSAEMTWTHWTMRVEPDPKPSSSEPSDSEPPQWVLRPSWQRLGMIAAQTGFCSVFISMLLGASGRSVRKVWVTPHRPQSPGTPSPTRGSGPPHVFVQTFGNSGSRAYVYPRPRISVTTQRGINDLRLDLKQMDASVISMYMQTEHALIKGERAAGGEVARALMARFGIRTKPQEGPKLRTGPIQPRA